MGIDAQCLRLLLNARRRGVSYARPMMIGRQNFSGLTPKQAAEIFRAFGQSVPDELPSWFDARYIEPMLIKFGAADVASLDCSDYEGANVIHDMNLPIPEELKNRFSVVIDCGTLEHVFNYPQALKSAMEMVAVGGHFLATTICNNWMGHGFYQFSPELFFRAFSEDNGFTLEDIFACESSVRGRWYRVSDPKRIGRPVELINSRPTYLLLQARRLRIANIFAAAPQQSNWAAAWAGPSSPPSLLKRILPEFVKRPIRAYQRPAQPKITNTSFFELVDDSELHD